MPAPDPFVIFTRKLEELRIPYLVSGSVAAIFYGEPRMTNDIDIILFLESKDVKRLAAAFPSDRFYCPPVDRLGLESLITKNGLTSEWAEARDSSDS